MGEFLEDWYLIAGDWLRAIHRTRRELLSGNEAAQREFDEITRRYVRRLLLQGATLLRLAEVADFPCPQCTCSSYREGPHEESCATLQPPCKKG